MLTCILTKRVFFFISGTVHVLRGGVTETLHLHCKVQRILHLYGGGPTLPPTATRAVNNMVYSFDFRRWFKFDKCMMIKQYFNFEPELSGCWAGLIVCGLRRMSSPREVSPRKSLCVCMCATLTTLSSIALECDFSTRPTRVNRPSVTTAVCMTAWRCICDSARVSLFFLSRNE